MLLCCLGVVGIRPRMNTSSFGFGAYKICIMGMDWTGLVGEEKKKLQTSSPSLETSEILFYFVPCPRLQDNPSPPKPTSEMNNDTKVHSEDTLHLTFDILRISSRG